MKEINNIEDIARDYYLTVSKTSSGDDWKSLQPEVRRFFIEIVRREINLGKIDFQKYRKD